MWKIAVQLNQAHFHQMEQLERQFYSMEFITPAETSCAYTRRFPRSTVAALEDDRVVGFVNLFPVLEDVYRAILTGTYNDSELTAAEIADAETTDGTPVYLFLSCIVVDRAHRKQGVTGALLRAAVSGYADIAQPCAEIVTDNVTDEGRRFSERLGFKFVCDSNHGSSVYRLSYAEFVNAVSAL